MLRVCLLAVIIALAVHVHGFATEPLPQRSTYSGAIGTGDEPVAVNLAFSGPMPTGGASTDFVEALNGYLMTPTDGDDGSAYTVVG